MQQGHVEASSTSQMRSHGNTGRTAGDGVSGRGRMSSGKGTGHRFGKKGPRKAHIQKHSTLIESTATQQGDDSLGKSKDVLREKAPVAVLGKKGPKSPTHIEGTATQADDNTIA